jgi:hypothetical protein
MTLGYCRQFFQSRHKEFKISVDERHNKLLRMLTKFSDKDKEAKRQLRIKIKELQERTITKFFKQYVNISLLELIPLE